MTPECLENQEYLELLKKSGVSLFVVDETHCISQWGHDFRPAYLTLRDAILKLGRPPVLALTATASLEVTRDIIRQLDIKQAEVVNLGIERKNLFFEVFRTVNDDEKEECLTRILREQGAGVGIVYVPTIRQANTLWKRLREMGFHVGRYHGKMKTSDRERTQQAFMNNEYAAIVATKAFGLGIDKPDLRFVVHYAIPDSVETYVQEAGRAGRDGKSARAILFYRLEDRRVQAYFLGGKYPRREECLRVYRALDRLSERGEQEGGVTLKSLIERAEVPQKRVKVIVAPLEDAGILYSRPSQVSPYPNRAEMHSFAQNTPLSKKRDRRLKKVRSFGSGEELTAFLEEYERRHSTDRHKLESMMKYGQTTECRMRYLTRYFGDEVSTDCGHCDNCRKGVTGQIVDTTALLKAKHRSWSDFFAASSPLLFLHAWGTHRTGIYRNP